MGDAGYSKAIIINSGNDSPQEELDYPVLLYKYILSKWYVYAAFLLLGGAISFFLYQKQQPVYEVTSKLLVREREQDYGPAEDLLQKNITYSSTSDRASNEIQILTSFSLMTDAVADLGLQTRYFYKYGVKERDAYGHFPVSLDTFSLTDLGWETGSFEIVPLTGDAFSMVWESGSGKYAFGDLFSNPLGVFRFEKTGDLAFNSDSSLRVSIRKPEVVAESYLNSLSVDLSDEKNHSSVLILTLRDAAPQRGKDVIHRLVENYNELKNKANTEITLKTLELIDERLAEISSGLSSAESTVESFRLRHNIVSQNNSDLTIMLENANQLAREQQSLEIQLNTVQVMLGNLSGSEDNFELIPANLSLLEGRIMDLVRPYNELVMERERLLVKAQPSNPVVVSTNQKLLAMRASISAALKDLEYELGLKLEKVRTQSSSASSRLRSVPTRERGLEDKVRTQSIKEDLYVYLLQKREETALALISNYSSALLVDPPHSSLDPVAPSKMKMLLAGGVGSLAIPFFFIILMDLLRNSIRTEYDLKQYLPGQPVVGVLNYYAKKGDLSLLDGAKNNMITERFRTIRTNLMFKYRNKKQCVLVTSSTSHEGKTFVATNLATSFALAQRKTVIVDFDLRKPSINRYFKGNESIGLSNYFLGEAALPDIIQTTPHIDNLDFIAGGPVAPNLVEAITEPLLTALFEQLKAIYDIVVIDCAPVGIISDGILLDSYVDYSLFVIRSGQTTKRMVEKAKEMFEQHKLVNPSIIFNGVKREHDEYGYGYGYGYGKGYKHYGYVHR